MRIESIAAFLILCSFTVSLPINPKGNKFKKRGFFSLFKSARKPPTVPTQKINSEAKRRLTNMDTFIKNEISKAEGRKPITAGARKGIWGSKKKPQTKQNTQG